MTFAPELTASDAAVCLLCGIPHNRHSFAVATMLDAYRSGDDPAAVLPVLSTWLGHAKPSDTYWYLTGTAELLAEASARLQGSTDPQQVDPT